MLMTILGGLTTLLSFALKLGALGVAALYVRPRRPDVWIWLAGPMLAHLLLSILGAGIGWGFTAFAFDAVGYEVAMPMLALGSFGMTLVNAALLGAFLAGVAKLSNPPAEAA